MATNQIKAINALTEELNAVKAKRQYVLVEGGLVQYGSDTVDVIDIDFIEGGEWSEATVEEAQYSLELMNRHLQADSYDRQRVIDFLVFASKEGLETHHPDCDRLLSWYNVNDAYREAEPEAELFPCNLGCSEALDDVETHVTEFVIIDVKQSVERAG